MNNTKRQVVTLWADRGERENCGKVMDRHPQIGREVQGGERWEEQGGPASREVADITRNHARMERP